MHGGVDALALFGEPWAWHESDSLSSGSPCSGTDNARLQNHWRRASLRGAGQVMRQMSVHSA